MSDDTKKVVAELLAPMLKKALFVAINRVAAPASAIEPFEEGVLVGDGLTILSTNTIEEARRAMEEEPLTKQGLRTFELRKWELREGRISLRASVSRYSL
jgi:uncharacterized protein